MLPALLRVYFHQVVQSSHWPIICISPASCWWRPSLFPADKTIIFFLSYHNKLCQDTYIIPRQPTNQRQPQLDIFTIYWLGNLPEWWWILPIFSKFHSNSIANKQFYLLNQQPRFLPINHNIYFVLLRPKCFGECYLYWYIISLSIRGEYLTTDTFF